MMVQRIIDYVTGNAFARNSLVLFSGTMTANVLNYIFHLVIGRMVDIETYGEIESLIALTTIISVPALTITMVATRFSAQMFATDNHADSKELLRYLQKNIALYGSILLILAYLLSPFVRDFLRLDSIVPVLFLLTAIFVAFFGAATAGVLSGWQRFRDVGLLSVYAAVTKLVLSIIFITVGFGVNGIVGSLVLSAVIAYGISLIMLRFIRIDDKIIQKKKTVFDVAKVNGYIRPIFFGSLAITILGNIDMVFAKNALDSISSGQYGALTVVGKIIFFATGVIATVLFSMSSGTGKDQQKSHRVFYNAFALTSFCGFGALVIYFLFPEFIMTLLFGGKYTDIAHYLGWFGVLAVLYSFANLIMQYLLSIHITRIVYYYIFFASVSIGLLYLFGDSFRDILTIMIVMQSAAICVGGFFIFRTNFDKCTD